MGFKKSSATFVINIFEGYGVAAQRFFSPQNKRLKSSSAKSSRAALLKNVVQDGTQELQRSVFHVFKASRLAAQLFSKKENRDCDSRITAQFFSTKLKA